MNTCSTRYSGRRKRGKLARPSEGNHLASTLACWQNGGGGEGVGSRARRVVRAKCITTTTTRFSEPARLSTPPPPPANHCFNENRWSATWFWSLLSKVFLCKPRKVDTLFQNGHQFWYSFIRLQISPCCLVHGEMLFWIFSLRTMQQGLICKQTKEY